MQMKREVRFEEAMEEKFDDEDDECSEYDDEHDEWEAWFPPENRRSLADEERRIALQTWLPMEKREGAAEYFRDS